MIRNGRERQGGPARRVALFIVFEGIDGCGKTLQAKMLAERLERDGFSVLLTAEPSDGPIGRRLRSLKVRPSPEEETRLFTEDRRDHVTRVILPALEEGRIVICDRYVHSSAAYQGAAGIDPSRIMARNLPFIVPPDVVFLLRVPVETALQRIRMGREGVFTSFEQRAALEAVDRIYRDIEDPAVRHIDGTGSPERVHQTILHLFRRLMSDKDAVENRVASGPATSGNKS
ncbi:MAG: dTMP kinase [Pseudomonadota bacterium]